jgi:hypothetical protein
MKRSLALALALASILVMAVVALPSVTTGWSEFLGTWTNNDKDTGGCTRFVISGLSPDTLVFQGYGKCHPSDCIWDPCPLVTYAASVDSGYGHYATWVWEKDYAVTIGILQFQGSSLQLTLYTAFLDGSGRSNYREVSWFKKSS